MHTVADSISIHYMGENQYIIKNTANGKYIKAGDRETAFLLSHGGEQQLDGLPLDPMIYKKLNGEECSYLTDYYLKSGFLRDPAAAKPRQDTAGRKLKDTLKNLVSLKVVQFDPDPLLNRTRRFFSPLFTWPALILMILFILSAYVAMGMNQNLFANLEELFRIEGMTIVLLIPTVFFSIVVHEFAHAIACKHFGGEVHKMGMLLFYFTPAFYADVSDIYLVKRRQSRAIVCLAGVISNFLLGSLSMHIYILLSNQGIQIRFLLFYFLFNMATGVYNLFPFVKMDGYWLLQNLFDEQNLMDKSRVLLYKKLFKREQYRSLELTPKQKAGYFAFAILSQAANLYFWYVSVVFLHNIAAHFLGIQAARIVAACLIVVILISMVFQVREVRSLNEKNFFPQGRVNHA